MLIDTCQLARQKRVGAVFREYGVSKYLYGANGCRVCGNGIAQVANRTMHEKDLPGEV